MICLAVCHDRVRGTDLDRLNKRRLNGLSVISILLIQADRDIVWPLVTDIVLVHPDLIDGQFNKFKRIGKLVRRIISFVIVTVSHFRGQFMCLFIFADCDSHGNRLLIIYHTLGRTPGFNNSILIDTRLIIHNLTEDCFCIRCRSAHTVVDGHCVAICGHRRIHHHAVRFLTNRSQREGKDFIGRQLSIICQCFKYFRLRFGPPIGVGDSLALHCLCICTIFTVGV